MSPQATVGPMKPAQASRVLAASPTQVFAVLGNPDVATAVMPCVVSSERLPGPEAGVGMRFRETRTMGKRRMTMEFEVTESRAPSHLRIVCDDHGTLWDSAFTLSEHPDGTELVITMDARAYQWLPRLLNPVMKPLFRKGLNQHLDALKVHFFTS
ncbi:MAG: hypothetical protein ACI80K_001230 [Paracoccaceae bacterium]|jgi:hypothetical protein